MLCQDRVNVFAPGDHASTYGGNPLACAAGLAVTSYLDDEQLLVNVNERGQQFRTLVSEIIAKYPDIVVGIIYFCLT